MTLVILVLLFFTDCSDISGGVSGIYNIRPHGADREYAVYCEVADDGVYTIIQQRVDDSVDFRRNWQEYKYVHICSYVLDIPFVYVMGLIDL